MIDFVVYYPIWKEALILAWPVMLNHIFTTAMRTTDMILMGFFGPAAVTAVGLGDVWESIILRIGLGLGTGSISLISQESGSDSLLAEANKDIILSQVIYVAFIMGIPFIFIGLIIPEQLIAPMHRSYYTVTTIMSGQKIGGGDVDQSKKTVEAMIILTIISIGSFSLMIFFTSPYLVQLFGENEASLRMAVQFLKAFSVGGPLITIYGVLAGHLNGAGNTKSALYGNLFSQTLLKLGLSYLLAVVFDIGLFGVLIAIPFDFLGRSLWVGRKYLSDDWIMEADLMIQKRRVESGSE